MIFLRECSDWLHAHFSGIVTLASLIYFGFLLLTWWNTRQLRKRQQTLQHLVRLRLAGPNGASLPLPYSIRRGQLSRGELLGILGMYNGEKRFEPWTFLSLFESSAFNDVLEGKSDELSIPCPPEFFQTVQEKLAARNKPPAAY
jgi:hypothetical protein